MTDIPGCIWGGHWAIRQSDDPTEIAALLAAAGGTAPGGETAAYDAGDLDFQEKNAVLRMELEAGRTMGVLRKYRAIDDVWPYDGGVGPDAANHDFEQWAMDRGCRLIVSFQSRFADGTYVPFSQVPTGVVDSELDAVADQIADFMANYDFEMLICPTHEPDMAYADTGETVAEMRAAYKAMFIYIRERFEAKWDADHPSFDQSKIKWSTIFVGNAAFWTGSDGALALYPGNFYVDYVGGDVYNGFGTATIGGQWGSLLEKIEPFLIFARSLGRTGQFVILGETGLIEGSPVIPDGSFGPSATPITIDIEPAQTIIPAGYLVDFFNGVVAEVASTVAPLDDTIDLVSLPGAVDASTPGAANLTTGRKATWFAEATVDIPASIPEMKYFCYFTGGFENWWIETPYEGSEASLAAWAAMGEDLYFGGSLETEAPEIPMLLQCLDDDEVTVLLSLTELNDGATYGFGIPPDGFELGGGELEDEVLTDYAYDGGVQLQSYRPPTVSRFPLILFGSSQDDLRARLRLLGELLDRPHTWEYRPRGSTQSLLIDAMRSPTPQVLQGGALDLLFVMNNLIGEPVVELRRQPKLRLRRREAFARKSISNVPGDNYMLVENVGNALSPLRISVQPQNSETQLVGYRVALKSFGNLTEAAATFLGFDADECDYPTGSSTTGHQTHDDPDAADLFVAISTFPNSTLLPRLRSPDDWRPVDPSALTGAHRVVVTGYADPGAVYQLQVRAGLISPLPDTGVIWPLDLTDETLVDAGDPVRFAIDLGLVQFDELGAALVLEVWASCDDPGAGHTISWDVVKLLPASEAIVGAYEPTYLGVIPGQMEWDPHAFVVVEHLNLPSTDADDDEPANSVGGDLDLDDDGRVVIGRADVVGTGDHGDRTDEAVGTAPNDGFNLPPGDYEVILTASLQNKDKTKDTLGELRVRRVNSGDEEDVAVTALKTQKNIQVTTDTFRARFTVEDEDELWQIQVVYTHDRDPLSGTPMRRKIWIDDLSMTFVRTISAPARAVLDGLTSPPRSYAAVAAGKSHDLDPTGTPEAPAGFYLLVFDFYEKPTPGTAAALAGGTLPLPTWWAQRRYKVVLDTDDMTNL